MRYDKRIRFYLAGPETYNPTTGQMGAAETLVAEKLCAVYDLSAEDRSTLLGRLGVRGLMVHHRGPVKTSDILIYEGQKYWVRAIRVLSNKATYLVEEAQDENQH